MQGNQQRYECNNLFQGRIPNRVIVGLMHSDAFNDNVARDPFCFQKFGVSNIRQLVRGEEYSYETLELVHNNSTQDLRGYYRFLQATGCLCKQSGELQIVLNFCAPPGNNITVILYGEFENLLEINKNKAMLYNIYQR